MFAIISCLSSVAILPQNGFRRGCAAAASADKVSLGGVVDDGDERCRRGCAGGVGLIDDVTLLGAGGERQHGREYQDNLLHYTEVMTKKIGLSFHCVGII